MRNVEPKEDKLKKLTEVFKYNSNLLIVMQNYPDPDSVASAVALRKLANKLGNLQCSIIHGGTVGRAENRALVKYLGLNLRSYFNLDISKYDLTAMVDTQPGFGNNAFPLDILPDIVIDHHPIHKKTRSCRFTDIRKNYGATATIMFEYLKLAGIKPDTKLATALLYAIRSDTQDLGRDALKADMEALFELYAIANVKVLSDIQRGKVRREYFQLLYNGLIRAKSYSNAIIASIGYTRNPDMIAEVADMLLRDDAANWTLVYGLCQNNILISIRTNQHEVSAEEIMKKLVARRGSGGGHASYAGGRIPLNQETKRETLKLEKIIRDRFLKLLNIPSQRGSRIIRNDKELRIIRPENGS